MDPQRRLTLRGMFLVLAVGWALLLAPGCDRGKAHDDLKDLMVTNTDPYDGETNVFINDPIVITFTANIDPATANTQTVQITDPNGAVPQGRFEVHSNELHFIPQYPPGLSPMMTYTVVLQGYPSQPTLLNTEGTPLMQTYQFQFDAGTAARPDTTPPYIVSCNIADGATNVPRDTNIKIVFSEPIDTSSASAGFTLTPIGASTTPVTGTLTLTNNQTELHFDPENGAFPGYLDANTQYQIQLTNVIRDMAGLSIQDPNHTPPQYPPWTVDFTTSGQPTVSVSRGPFLDDFTTNANEDASNTDAEWNTVTPGALVSRVFPQSLPVTDPGPSGSTTTVTEPFDPGTGGGGYRAATIILASEIANALGQPLSNIANMPITRLLCKTSSGTPTAATYSNLVVRLGITTNTAFPQSVANFSGTYLQGTSVVPPTVVARLSNFTVQPSPANYPGYFEIPISPTFIYTANANDNLIVDIELTGATAQNHLEGDDQGVATPPAPPNQWRRAIATNPAANYDTITTFDHKVPYFAFEFGGGLGSAGVDGAGNQLTTIQFPLGSGNDIHVATGATLDTAAAGYGLGHLKVKSLTVDPGATLTVHCGSAQNVPTFPNPCLIRVERTVRIDGRINADGGNGANAASATLSGGAGGLAGPGAGHGGSGGTGAGSGAGSNGNPGNGFDNQTSTTNGAGQAGNGGAGGGGGGGGGYGVVGSQGIAAGSATGGAGGNSWGTPNLIYYAGGGGGGGGGGGVATTGAGGGGGGGGGGYLHILTERNMYFGPNAQVTAKGGRGGGAAVLGQGGGGGGGAGGAVYLQALQLAFTGPGAVINVQGGAGGLASAGGGHGAPQTGVPHNHQLADGRILIEAAVQNQSNCTFTPSASSNLVLIRGGSGLSGQYLVPPATQAQSTGQSLFLDTTCSWPRYLDADINFSDSSGVTTVYVNFEGADPDITAQPTENRTLLYSNGAGPNGAEFLPSPSTGGQNPAVIDLNNGEINGGASAGGRSPTGVQPLNGLRYIRFIITLETQNATTTAQVTQVTIRYEY